jgi:hypothetical protein
MSGASVILFVNLMVGGLLSAFFLVLALYDRRLVSARWFAAAYAFGVAYVIGEFVHSVPRRTGPLASSCHRLR